MTLLAPIPLALIGWAALALGGLAVVAYILKMRRRRFEVPFSTLWQRVLRERDATSLWRRFRRWLSLLLTLAILGLTLLAATGPRLGGPDTAAKNVVILLDASASMKTVDAGDDHDRARIAVAKDEVQRLLGAMGSGDSVMVMTMDGQTAPLTRFESDTPRLARMVGGVEATDTRANLRQALTAAADALRGRKNPMIILVGDGAYDKATLDSVSWKKGNKLDSIDLAGIDVRYLPVGQTGDNVGIVAFNARRFTTDKTSYQVYIEVQNFGAKPARRKLVLYNGDLATDARTIQLGPGEKLRQIYSRGGGEDSVLRASLEQERDPAHAGASLHDAFALDDTAWALLPARRKQHVLLVTRDNLYLEGAMLVYDNIEVDKLTPEEYDKAMSAGRLPTYQAVVFDDVTPAALPPPPTNLMYFHPEGPSSPLPIRGHITHPHITQVNDSHPVTRYLVMSDVNFDDSDVFSLDRDKGQVALAQAVRSPVMAAVRGKDRKIVVCGFSLGGTDLVLRVAFPLLLVNTLDWFAADQADLITTYTTGTRVRVPMDGVVGASEVAVRAPGGKVSHAPLSGGQVTFYASEVGIHTLTARADGRVLAEEPLAANLSSPAESAIAPVATLEMGGQSLARPAGLTASHRQALWLYLVLLVLLLLGVEWVTFHRRVTV